MTRDATAESSQESVQYAYDTVAEDYAALISGTRTEAAIDLAMVDAFIAAVGAGARVLDAGCGAGRMSRYLADLSVVVEGIDLSPGMISAARLHHPDLAFVVGSISDLAYEDDSFDGVMLWYSTIHTVGDRQQRLYSEASRVLKRGATCSSAPRPVQACTTPRLPTVATATTSTWSAPVHCR